MNLENRLLRLLGRKHYVPAGADDITKKLELGQAQAAEVRSELRNPVRLGRVVKLPENHYARPVSYTHASLPTPATRLIQLHIAVVAESNAE